MPSSLLYVPEPLEGIDVHPFFYFRYAPTQKQEVLFAAHLPPNFFESTVSYTTSPEGAQAIVLAHNFRFIDERVKAYIARYADKAEELHIPLFLFSFGDFMDTLQFDPRAWVLRLSLYASSKGLHDIIVPTLTDDIGYEGIVLRPKSDVPAVSFCGQAGYPTLRQWLRYYLKVARNFAKPERRLGVFWRRRMLRACRSPLLRTSFIIRRSFSGAQRTIELDPAQARKDFIENVRDSDFVLAPKGDGNYSNRFLEALSMGRIPVVVDTDIVLPLEERVDYAKIIVRVPMRDIRETPRYIREFYDVLSEEEWHARQRVAREVFEKYLRQDAFFEHLFWEAPSKWYSAQTSST